MEAFAGATRALDAVERERLHGAMRDDFVTHGDFDSFAFAIDPKGRLAWASNDIDGDYVGAVLSTRAAADDIAFLRERRVSYLLAGEDDVDLALALEKIGARFGVRTRRLEGGGRTNGSFLAAGLIGEVSLRLAPVADARVGTPALFDIEGDGAAAVRLGLDSLERREHDVLWLRYRPSNHRT
jgi:2,5-diamino-6-(ribosylamino)-4(3H)-pyrimidinone 5'-phosphate reductase